MTTDLELVCITCITSDVKKIEKSYYFLNMLCTFVYRYTFLSFNRMHLTFSLELRIYINIEYSAIFINYICYLQMDFRGSLYI